jgi:hypothetical protein
VDNFFRRAYLVKDLIPGGQVVVDDFFRVRELPHTRNNSLGVRDFECLENEAITARFLW